MKKRLLEMAKALSKTGIEYQFKDVRVTQEFIHSWNSFWKHHKKLEKQIKMWGEEYAQTQPGPLFSFAEDVKHPLEIAAIIKLINDPNVSEEKLFEDRDDLFNLLYDLQTPFATLVAVTIEHQLINNATCLGYV